MGHGGCVDFNGFCRGLLMTVEVVVVMGLFIYLFILVVGCGCHNGDYD